MSLTDNPMPSRHEPAAPKLDDDSTKKQCEEIPRYFDDLEELFDARPSLADLEKKKYAVFYLKARLQAVWKAFPEFSDASKTYYDFRTAILDSLYTFADLNQLVVTRYNLGISTLVDLAHYTRNFGMISSALIRRGLVSDSGAQRTYLQAFQPSFLAQIAFRLQIRHPERAPDAVDSIDDVFDAAEWIIRSDSHSPALFGSAYLSLAARAVVPLTSPSTRASHDPSTPPSNLAPPQSIAQPEEDIGEVIEKLAHSIADSILEKVTEVLEQQSRPIVCSTRPVLPRTEYKSPTLTRKNITTPAPHFASSLPRSPPPPITPLCIQCLDELSPSERRHACTKCIQEMEDEIAALRKGPEMSTEY